ncbi:MAG: NAD(P)H-hydrate dehydratase [Actinobacteria bacterium]|nr:NAD(P)H-hydrate dehydratase [Actinomycetota bacterium]
MIPVLTAAEMREVDVAAPEPVEALIERAGAAVARAALEMLGGPYGRRVVVVAGKGNNGADGRAAAARLERRGVRVSVIDATDAPPRLPPADLVIDAAYGTGFHGTYEPPDPAGAPVLAVDVPSGGVVRADRTVTFAALKPALLFGAGAGAGEVDVVDIGLDVRGARVHVMEDADVVVPRREHDAHKWQSAVCVVGGSPGMMGAVSLVARSAMRSGAGYVRLCAPGGGAIPVAEAVTVLTPADDWAGAVLAELERCRALVVGPGLGRGDAMAGQVRRLVAESPVPVVVDADGLNALAAPGFFVANATSCVHERDKEAEVGAVLTPHDGEYERLMGRAPGADRIEAARALAVASGAVALLKGPATVVAAPDGRALISVTGGPALATAGTGDVLSGVIGAFVARGLPPFEAAAYAAHVHGAASGLGFRQGLVAGDLPDLIARWLSGVHSPRNLGAMYSRRGLDA